MLRYSTTSSPSSSCVMRKEVNNTAVMASTRSVRICSRTAYLSIFLVGIAVVVAGASIVDATDEEAVTTRNKQLRRRQMKGNGTGKGKEKARPVMHTFFSRRKGGREKGMSDKVDEEMLEVWKASWSAAGWEPKVLTLEDARKHPQFDRVNESLHGLPVSEYDRLCFLRWLAMAANGGGWMSDYDTFPLHPIAERTSSVTPNEGRFSVYDRLVPSLVSGSAEEWDRMARLLVENAVEHKDGNFWSDMFAMVNLFRKHDPNVFISTSQVETGSTVLTGKHFGEGDCTNLLSGRVAIHFSHSAINWAKKSNTLRKGEGLADRPRIASNIMKIFEERCTKKEVAVSGPTTTKFRNP